MRLGLYVRNMGPQSSPATVLACARAAERAGIDELYIGDHIAIPPDDAEGSGGRYLDPLATIAWLAGATERIRLGTGVLVLPYRPALPTAKWVATIQEISGGRFLFGVGVGWMAAEFRAVGADMKRRGAITDEILAFLHECFAGDEVEANGQPFLFLPRPPRPPILVGGAAPHALRRVVRYGDGWMPFGGAPAQLRPQIAELQRRMADAGRPPADIVVVNGLPFDDPPRAAALLRELEEIGATCVVHGRRYADAAEFARDVDALVAAAGR